VVRETQSIAALGGEIFQEKQIGDYIDLTRRKKWWVILTTLAFFVTCTVVGLRLPNVYHSETVILIDPQQVPSSVVASTVSTSIMDRLSTIRQEVMSPTKLATLTEQMNLFPELRANGKTELAIATVQKSISIDLVDAGGQRLSAFKIGYTSKDPVQAAKVANQLAENTKKEHLRAREEEFSGAAEFLDTELQDTKRQLEAKESELQRIKTQYITDLPESKQYHLEILTSLRTQLQTAQDRINHDQQEKVYLQALMLNTNPTVDLDAEGGGAPTSPRQAQINKLESKLSDLKAHYGPGHPDVRKLQAQLDELKTLVAADEAKNPLPAPITSDTQKGAEKSRNPVLEAKATKLEQDIDEQSKLQPVLQQKINDESAKLEMEPIFEQRMAGLMRDYDTLRSNYNILLGKKLAAEEAQHMETRQKGERFVTLDEAQVPSSPAGPNRILMSVGGLILGLLAGIALAVAMDMMDQSVRSEQEAAQLFNKSILGGIPLIVTESQTRMHFVRMFGAVVATMVFSAGLGVLLAIVKDRLS
jgi:succinoglycan biosynthesis transport protein ExoP